jgi:AAA domain/LAGLIDADG-like domain
MAQSSAGSFSSSEAPSVTQTPQVKTTPSQDQPQASQGGDTQTAVPAKSSGPKLVSSATSGSASAVIPADTMVDPKKGPPFIIQSNLNVLRWLKLLVYAEYGAGKAQPLGCKILTPNGWTTMGKIQPGDRVITPTGEIAAVTGCFPQGVKDIYSITFQDGASTRCCLDHIWEVSSRQQEHDRGSYKTKTLKEILEDPLKRTRETNYEGHDLSSYTNYIPIIDRGLDLTRAGASPEDSPLPLPLHPYLLGTLIGDGGLTVNQPSFTSADSFIAEKVRELLPEGDILVKTRAGGSDIYMRINGGSTKEAIQDLGLWGHKSPEKFIPEQYLWTTWENRLQILQGLMDTDGTAGGPSGGYPTFNTSSKELAKAVRFLVQSLGGTSTSSLRDAPARTGKGLLAYNVQMRLPPGVVPFLLPRKADLFKSAKHAVPLRGIEKIVHLGPAEAKCISISDPQGLYITDEFVVTHNTLLAGTSVEVPAMRDVLMISAEAGDLTLFDPESNIPFTLIDIVHVTDYRTTARVHEFLKLHCEYRDQAAAGDKEAIDILFRLQNRLMPGVPDPERLRLYRTSIIDTITEVETYCMQQLLGISDTTLIDEEVGGPEWAEYNKQRLMIHRLIRNFRNLPMNTIFTCQRQFKENERKIKNYLPAMTGKLSNEVQGFMDMVGFLVVGDLPSPTDEDPDPTAPRRMFIQPGPRYVAKNRFRQYKKSYFDNPTALSIFEAVGLDTQLE